MGRVKWIDVIKGIGIFLVVWGHSNLLLTGIGDSSYITKYIYSFHMPLFFFTSGYLRDLRSRNFKELITKKINTLIIPYVFFSTFAIMIDVIRYKSNFPLAKEVFGFLYFGKRVLWNDPLWFLICLFFVEIIYYGITQLKNRRYSLIALLFCAIIGFWLSYKKINLPFGLSIAFIGISFYGIGNFVSNRNSIRINKLVIVACLAISVIIPIYFNSTVSMYFMKYGNPTYFYIAALLNIFLYIQLSKRIEPINIISGIFQYLGKNSLIILCTHFMLIFLLRVCISRITVLDFYIIHSDLLKGLIYASIVLVISAPIIYIIKNRFPFIIGIKREVR